MHDIICTNAHLMLYHPKIIQKIYKQNSTDDATLFVFVCDRFLSWDSVSSKIFGEQTIGADLEFNSL